MKLFQMIQSRLVLIFMFSVILQNQLMAATGSVNTGQTYQIMDGFGASIAWYDNDLVNHPNKEDIYFYMFSELGLDILRLKNGYNKDNIQSTEEIIERLWEYTYNDPIILLSSWSPPANLKSNGVITDGGTLIKENGEFAYDAFARYWTDALDAYADMNVFPDYISIQNEPGFSIWWESCIFRETQNATFAGYDRALEAVHAALQELDNPPKILAPEVLGIGYSLFQNYARRFNHDLVDGYAYHLYHGESNNVNDNSDPDLFIPNLGLIARQYPEKPIWQTEYDRGDWFNTVWLMHNCLVHGNVSAYLYWYLISSSAGGHELIQLESYSNPALWTTDEGFIIRKEFWAFRQYAFYIDPGYIRVNAETDDDDVRMSAFISPEGDYLTMVVLNVGASEKSLNLNIQGFEADDGEVVLTSETEDGTMTDSHYDGSDTIDLPVRSITTILLEGETTRVDHSLSAPAAFFLYPNHPNPFNSSTLIQFTLHEPIQIALSIYNLKGQKIRTLIDQHLPAGHQKILWDGTDASGKRAASGIYIYKLSASSHRQQNKMILLD